MKTILYLLLVLGFSTHLFMTDSHAQQQVLEFTASNQNPDASDTGPIYETTIRFLNNIDDPTGNEFNPHWPETAKITVSNFNTAYTHAQNSLNAEEIESLISGWNFDDDPTLFETEGTAESYFELMNKLPASENIHFTSLGGNSNPDQGIDITVNRGVLFSAGLQALSSETVNGRYRLADLEIEFNRPQNNPVLHLVGLGAIWGVDFDNGTVCLDDPLPATLDDCTNTFDVVDNSFTNSASIELDLISQVSESFGGFNKLSGTGVFSVNSNSSEASGNQILNSSNEPNDNQYSAHGSVEIVGENITSLTFSVYVEGRNTPDPCGLGWGGGTGWVFQQSDGTCSTNQIKKGHIDETSFDSNEQNDDATYNFAQDAWMLSVSSQLDDDEVTLLEGDSFRMLSSPIVSTAEPNNNTGISYRDLIGTFWVQGEFVTSNAGDENFYQGGTSNIYTWPIGENETTGNWFSGESGNLFDIQSPIPVGQGFLMTVFYSDDGPPQVDWPAAGKQLLVTGSEPAPPIIVENTGQSNGWLLAGNPFKDPIDLNELLRTDVTELPTRIDNLKNVIYVWDRGLGQRDDTNREAGWRFALGDVDNVESETIVLGNLVQSNSSGGNSETAQTVLLPFQGFFIQRLDNTAQSRIIFDGTGSTGDEDLTRDGIVTTASENDQFFRKDRNVNNLAILNLSGEGLRNSLWLRFSEKGSTELLQNDALELASLNKDYALFATRKSEETLLTLAQLPIPDEEFEIPVVVEATRPGLYSITADDFNIDAGQDLYFTDTVDKKNVLIDKNFSYSFTLNQTAKQNDLQGNPLAIGPKKAVSEFTERFYITTQPKEFKSELPDEVALNQNYPNPFNPTTQITYQLPQQSDVRLQVFDMAGRQVATLVNESVNAGTHTVNFDASSLSSGVYLYKLQAGSTTLSKKLTLIK